MAKQFALSTRSFDKFQEKEVFSGILPEGISQNIIQRVFLKLQETLKWISIIYIYLAELQNYFFHLYLLRLSYDQWNESKSHFEYIIPYFDLS